MVRTFSPFKRCPFGELKVYPREISLCAWRLLLRKLLTLFVVTGVTFATFHNSVGHAEEVRPPLVFDPTAFQQSVDNPWFPLVPGTAFTLHERKGKKVSVNVVTVTAQTKLIQGVNCVVVHDTVSRDGALKEDTYDWFASDQYGNVWYFGEDTRQFRKNGDVIRAGSWQAGVAGAEASLLLPASGVIGAPFKPEGLPGGGLSQVESFGDTVTVPMGTYSDTMRTGDWTSPESKFEKKWYAKGVGFVRSESSNGEIVELISITKSH